MTEVLIQALRAGYPIFALQSGEEKRALTALKALGEQVQPPMVVRTWSVRNGLEGAGEHTQNLAEALAAIVDGDEGGIYVLLDPDPHLQDPVSARMLKQAYLDLMAREDRIIVLLSSFPSYPESVAALFPVVELPLPDSKEFRPLIQQILQLYPSLGVDDEGVEWLASRLDGLTLDAAQFALQDAFAAEDRGTWAHAINLAKKRYDLTGEALAWVETEKLEPLAGYLNLLEWIEAHAAYAEKPELAPGGLLLMGVAGCGKSLAVKVLAQRWSLPLVRLDFSLLYSSPAGPEAAFSAVLERLGRARPIVMWIDELENAFTNIESNEQQARIFATFLTWLQDKEPGIFVAATANRVQDLPPELLRKGRFDELFFLDLPKDEERKAIFGSHFERHGIKFNEDMMGRALRNSEGFSPAEIAHIIKGTLFEGFTEDGLIKSLRKTVPLSTTRKEDIKALKDWAWQRARTAGK